MICQKINTPNFVTLTRTHSVNNYGSYINKLGCAYYWNTTITTELCIVLKYKFSNIFLPSVSNKPLLKTIDSRWPSSS